MRRDMRCGALSRSSSESLERCARCVGERGQTRAAQPCGGRDDGDDGGGIDIKGSGIVELSFVTISGSKASRGGGIFAEATGGPLTLELKSDTVILGNTATGDGGGIWAKGDVLLFLIEPQVTVSSNHAPNGRGGGIYIEGRVQLALGRLLLFHHVGVEQPLKLSAERLAGVGEVEQHIALVEEFCLG